MTFGKGWKPDGPEHAHVGAEHIRPRAALGARAGGRPPSYDLRAFFSDRIRDQNGASECVGFALARALRVRSCVEVASGTRSAPIPYPSSHAIYALGRDPAGDTEELADDGCVPRLAVYACATYGVVGDARWPFDMATILEHVPPDVLRAGADGLVDGFVPIAAGDVDAVRDAIAAGHPVVGGLTVDNTFEQYSGGVMPDNDGSELGGHMLCFLSYGTDNGVEFIGGDNSWSEDWGEGGRFRMSLARASRVSDLYALLLSPEAAS